MKVSHKKINPVTLVATMITFSPLWVTFGYFIFQDPKAFFVVLFGAALFAVLFWATTVFMTLVGAFDEESFWRVGCKYLSIGVCKKCDQEHTLTFDEYSNESKTNKEGDS